MKLLNLPVEHCTAFHVGRKKTWPESISACGESTGQLLHAWPRLLLAQVSKPRQAPGTSCCSGLSDRKQQTPLVQPGSSQGRGTAEIPQPGSCVSRHLVGLCVFLEASAARFYHLRQPHGKTMTRNRNCFNKLGVKEQKWQCLSETDSKALSMVLKVTTVYSARFISGLRPELGKCFDW